MHFESKFDVLIYLGFALLFSYFGCRWFFKKLFSKRRGNTFFNGDLLYLKKEKEFAVIKNVNRLLGEVVIEHATHETKTHNYYRLLSNSSNFSKMRRNYASIPLHFKVTSEVLPLINEDLLKDIVSLKSKNYLTKKKPITIQFPCKKQEELQIMVPMYTENVYQVLKTLQTLKDSISSYIEELAANQRSKIPLG